MEHFYITISSNTPSHFDNTSANFKVKLPTVYKLSEDWVVGVAVVTYTYSWYNITEQETIWIKYYDAGKVKSIRIVIPEGFYTIDRLIGLINRLIAVGCTGVDPPVFQLIDKKLDKRVNILFGIHKDTFVYPLLSENLCYILGFKKSVLDDLAEANLLRTVMEAEFYFKNMGINVERYEPQPLKGKMNYLAQSPYDISGGVHTIFLYCDIIKHCLVGDSQTQLIRYVKIPNDVVYNDQVHIKYENIQYHNIISKELDCIEINFRDDAGKNIPFSHAKNVVVLHFKKINKRDEINYIS